MRRATMAGLVLLFCCAALPAAVTLGPNRGVIALDPTVASAALDLPAGTWVLKVAGDGPLLVRGMDLRFMSVVGAVDPRVAKTIIWNEAGDEVEAPLATFVVPNTKVILSEPATLRFFFVDSDLNDNSGSLQVVAHEGQEEGPEGGRVTVDAREHCHVIDFARQAVPVRMKRDDNFQIQYRSGALTLAPEGPPLPMAMLHWDRRQAEMATDAGYLDEDETPHEEDLTRFGAINTVDLWQSLTIPVYARRETTVWLFVLDPDPGANQGQVVVSVAN